MSLCPAFCFVQVEGDPTVPHGVRLLAVELINEEELDSETLSTDGGNPLRILEDHLLALRRRIFARGIEFTEFFVYRDPALADMVRTLVARRQSIHRAFAPDSLFIPKEIITAIRPNSKPLR